MKVKNYEPLFIIGYPRSGTTYLLHLLLSSGHYPVYNFTETHFYSHYYRRYGPLENNKNFNRLCRDIVSSSWFKKSGVTCEEFMDNIKIKEYGAVFSSIMNTISQKQNKKRWVEKTPWHLKFVREIVTDFPNAKFVLIVRDPRDVVLSIRNYGWNSGILNMVVKIAIAWRWHMEHVCKDLYLSKAKYIVIKYEDLVLSLDKSIEKINNFLDLNIRADILKNSTFGVLGKPNSSFVKDTSASTNIPVYRWRNFSRKKDISIIEYAVGPQIKKWGYEYSGVRKRTYLKPFIIIIRFAYYYYRNIKLLLFPLVQK